MSAGVSLRGVSKAYGEVEVLKHLDLDIPAGQIVSIIGPSGSGKSTLLRLLMTLDKPDAGLIEIDGESPWHRWRGTHRVPGDEAHLRQVRGKIGMVFQHFNLFPHMTALGNVMEAPRQVLGLTPEAARERAERLLARVGLAEKSDSYPWELSGGQKQRVAIARALAMEPRLTLFDEITSALDPELVSGVLDLLRELAEEGAMTMLIVTHHMRFAQECSDRTLFFDAGRIVEDAAPEQLFRSPQHARTRQFLDSVLGADG